MPSYRAFVYSDSENLQYAVTSYHNPKRWKQNILPENSPLRDASNWSSEMRYFDFSGQDYSNEIKKLPTTTGGVYIFYLKGINLPFIENYILYVGRCRYTPKRNIRKRAKEYYNDKRELISFMKRQWRDYLYYRFYPDTNNAQIDKNEELLIKAILPMFNERIPDSIERQITVSAFK